MQPKRCRCPLVNWVVPDDELDARAWRGGERARAGPTFALGIAKKMFKLMYQPDLETLLDAEAWAQGIALLSDDHKEGVRAFFDKRKPQFKGS
jgi:2-(1,2-epoxy-1,2-dihydrophenyl)acetyl-CoA isomerase